MPIVGFDPAQDTVLNFTPRNPKPQLDKTPSLLDQTLAAFQLENVAVNAYQRATEDLPEDRDPAFDPRDHLQPGEEIIASRFADDQSVEEMNQTRARVERERKARETLSAGGPVSATALSMLAAGADITSLIPFGGGFGRSIASGAIRGVASGAAANAVGEAALQGLQETRTFYESLAAVTVGGVLGGGLGAAGAVISRGSGRAGALDDPITRAAIDDMRANYEANLEAPINTDNITESVGAAVARAAPEDSLLANTAGAQPIMAALGRVGLEPAGFRLARSNFASVREASSQLIDTGLITQGNVRGYTSGAPAETVIKGEMARLQADLIRSTRETFREYRKRVGRQGSMTYTQFREQVGKSLRRGDQSATPEVQQAAQRLRATILNPALQRAQAARLLPNDIEPTTAPSYLTRVYDRINIRRNRPEFTRRVKGYLGRVAQEQNEELTDAELEDIADQIIDKIMGHGSGNVPLIEIPPGPRGALKERTFNIPDADIEEFLVSDVQTVLGRYIGTVIPDILLTERFGRPDFQEGLAQRIRDEAAARSRDETLTPAARQALADEAENEIKVLDALINLVRNRAPYGDDGSYDGLRRFVRGVRTLNFLTDLGSVTLSSIPDVGLQVLQEGLGRTLRAQFSTLATGAKSLRMAKREAQLAGTALENTLASRARAVWGLGEQFERETAFERGLDQLGSRFSQVSLLSPWTDTMKSMTAQMVSTRIIETSRKVADKGMDALSKGERTRLARAGIDETMARRIASQAQGEGVQEFAGGIKIADTEQWTDAVARRTFRDALLSDVDNTVVSPGSGDAPIWTSTEWGKTLFQYKRFGTAVMQKATIAGLQRRDMAALNGLAAVSGLGVLGTALRDIAKEGQVEDRNVQQWVVEGVDRGGLLMVFTELNAISDKATGISAIRAITGEEPSRFGPRSLVGQLFGPTAGTIFDTQDLLRSVTDAVRGEQEFTTSDLHRLRRMIPGQNLFYLRYLFNEMETALAEGAGIPEPG